MYGKKPAAKPKKAQKMSAGMKGAPAIKGSKIKGMAGKMEMPPKKGKKKM